MKKEIKPCPFCGNDVEIDEVPLWHGTHGYFGCYEYKIRCNVCGCSLQYERNDTIYRSKNEAKDNVIEAWNKRTGE